MIKKLIDGILVWMERLRVITFAISLAIFSLFCLIMLAITRHEVWGTIALAAAFVVAVVGTTVKFLVLLALGLDEWGDDGAT